MLDVSQIIEANISRSVKLRVSKDEEEIDELTDEASMSKCTILTGPPGTGQTTVALSCIDTAKGLGGRVLCAMPTGALASRVRKFAQKKEWAHVDVDTTAAAFSLMEGHVMQVPALGQYDFLWVDEISQHSMEEFERVT